MVEDIGRRTFLRRVGQAGGLVIAGGSIEALLAACGGNVSTGGGSTPTPGATVVGNQGLKAPGLLQWGADYVSGAPYVFQDPTNPKNLIGFEVEIAQAIAPPLPSSPLQAKIDATVEAMRQAGAPEADIEAFKKEQAA